MKPIFIFFILTIFGSILALDISDICGTTEYAQSLISRGTSTERGEFPFLAALFWTKESKFVCGGSLISQKHVLTAGHCLNGYDFTLQPDDVLVLLGAYDLSAIIERGTVQRDVIEIHIHPDWDVYSDKDDADLGILVLSEKVKFTNYIRPVCMPPDNSVVVSTNGTIVGWGLTENGTEPHLEYPIKGNTVALNDSYCYTSDHIVALFSSLRTFCGSGGSSNPNRGDSGGGFFVRYGSAWVQYGIVSVLLRSDASGYDNINTISIYTNVNDFKKWIVDKVTQSGVQVGEASGTKKIRLKCQYIYQNGEEIYGCYLHNLEIRSENIEVASFTGSHVNGKSDEDVKLLQFYEGTAIYLPDGIGKFFNLTHIEVGPSVGTKFIKRSNFKNLETLDYLDISINDVQDFEDNILWDLPELKHFKVYNNQLKTLEENTFVYNIKLKVVELMGNKLESLPANLFRNNSLLEKVDLNSNSLKTIHEIIFVNNGKLTEFIIWENKLESIPEDLFRNNLLLDKVLLGHNSFKTIHERTFANNGKLTDFDISWNQLEAIPENLFHNNVLLEIVNFERNSVKTIHERTFVNNVKLKKFDISENELESLPANLFQNNRLLEEVRLNFNSLKTIHKDTFSNNVELANLDLSYNQLETIPGNLLKNNLFLEVIKFSGNHLKVIDIDVTVFKYIQLLDFQSNSCVDWFLSDARFNPGLIELQNAIRANCTSDL